MMARFIDGPAAGVVLQIRRTPVMLRVARGPNGEWDALDQLDDEARPDESIYVYRMKGEPSRVHVCRSPRRLSGWLNLSDYEYFEPQPDDAQIRTTAAWQAWANALQAAELKED